MFCRDNMTYYLCTNNKPRNMRKLIWHYASYYPLRVLALLLSLQLALNIV